MPKLIELKSRRCAKCRTKFVPDRPFITWCSPECGAELAKAKIARQNALRAKKARKEYRDAKEKQKTRSDWLREAQQAFNAFIRARDKDQPCISSGVMQATWDAGHYRSVGSCPELRFNELNCHKQSVHDNQHLHGNLIAYRKGLIERIGAEAVEWLEGPHEPKKYTIEELKEIKATYKAKLKALVK